MATRHWSVGDGVIDPRFRMMRPEGEVMEVLHEERVLVRWTDSQGNTYLTETDPDYLRPLAEAGE